MNLQEEIYCPHCKKTFYLRGFRLQEAKTVSCMFCKKRITKENQNKRDTLRSMTPQGFAKAFMEANI